MKKITKKKTLTAVTGATVIGVAAAALVNGSKLESVFNPGKFEKFENNYKSEEYDYVSGDGEKTDISGDNTQKKEKNKGDNLQVLQLQKQDNGKLNDPSSFGIADNGTVPEESDNADAQENAEIPYSRIMETDPEETADQVQEPVMEMDRTEMVAAMATRVELP